MGEDTAECTERHKSRLCLGPRSGVHGSLQRVEKKVDASGKLGGNPARVDEVGIVPARNCMLHKLILMGEPEVVTLLTVPV